ncbi:MAG: ubiquinone biosynthesis regulatory protein kinase UbiB [Methylomicrobium sp.]|nr:ubiquinone biosynthesis regulatory protein kinase UbiB [Methylomicrobium sp.]
MIRPKILLRLIHINWVLVYHGLDEIVLKTHLFRPIRYLVYLSPAYWTGRHNEPRGVRIRKTLEELGPIYVKFGQALSTRKDLLPDDIADELVKLQDRVPPFSSAVARTIIEKELGATISETFAEFDDKPLASASVAQVHTAVLPDGRKVIVKVLRPDIEKRIQSDVGLLSELARFAERFWKDARRLRPLEVVAEFEKTTLDELDLVREAANAAKLRRNFENSELIYVPEVYWPLTRQKVMVMERIHGIPVGDIEQLRAGNADFKLLAERGVEIFFTQVFRDNFFHADMHPGNIFVELPAKYLAVDFGIVGTLSPSDQRYLAENFLAFFNRDYHRVAQMHVESGWVPGSTRVEEFESAIRSVCEPIFEKPLKDISFGHLLLRLFQTARRFDMHVQPQLVLLQKTLLNIEGLGRQLYPELDLWQTAKPFLEKWFHERLGPQAKIKKVLQQFPELAEKFPEIPMLVFKALDDASHAHEQMTRQNYEMHELRKQIEKNHNGLMTAIIISAAMVSVALLMA